MGFSGGYISQILKEILDFAHRTNKVLFLDRAAAYFYSVGITWMLPYSSGIAQLSTVSEFYMCTPALCRMSLKLFCHFYGLGQKA